MKFSTTSALVILTLALSACTGMTTKGDQGSTQRQGSTGATGYTGTAGSPNNHNDMGGM